MTQCGFKCLFSSGPVFRSRFVFVPQKQQALPSQIRARAIHSGLLYLQKADDTVVPAEEEDFYRYTTKRWLSNETLESSKRYVKFNIQALLTAATQSVRGAQRCTCAIKYQEGQYNKVFLLILDNGSEVVAKIPNPNAGPRHHTVASEVATMDFVRSVLHIPVPRVISWSSDSSNPLGAEYIIMEKAKGSSLGSIWYSLPRTVKNEIIEQVVEMEAKFASFKFPEHGSLYSTHDPPTGTLPPSRQEPLPGDSSGKFFIGPSVRSAIWTGGDIGFGPVQGPWRRLTDYANCLGVAENIWTRKYAKPRMNYYRSYDKPEMPEEYLDLVQKYLLVAPHLAQSSQKAEDILTPTLWHHDLHLNNIYINLATNTITDIIDWQGVTVAPLLLQAKMPRMVRHVTELPLGWVMPEKPANYDTLGEKEKLKADKLLESALCHKYYEALTAKRNPRHCAALTHKDTWELPYTKPLEIIPGAWSSQEIFKLRSSLITISENWRNFQFGEDVCPISFTEEEKKLHDEEMENRDYVEEMMEQFQEDGILPADGIVDPRDFEVLRRVSNAQKEQLMELAEDEDQRAWLDKIWPYQDNEGSLNGL